MEINREVKHSLEWHSNEGKFNVTIINGVITELTFCEIGRGGDEGCGKCITSVDYKFLKQVHECLGDVFNHLEKEARLNGHSFAGENITEKSEIPFVKEHISNFMDILNEQPNGKS